MDLPDSFPVPDGARRVDDRSDGDVLRVAFSLGDDDALPSFFLERLPDAGFEIIARTGDPDEVVIEFDGNGFYGQIELLSGSGRFWVQLVR